MLRQLKGLIKALGDGEIIGVASTADPDRDREIIIQQGWDLKNFLENPVILAHHNYHNFPIGKAVDIGIEDGKLTFKMKFTDATEEARQAYQLVKEGVLNTFSVGFIPREYDAEDQNIIRKAELLEISLVTVPANPKAVVIAKGMKKNDLAVELCKQWLLDEKMKKGVEEEEKAIEEEQKNKGAVQEALNNPSPWKVKDDNCRKIWDAYDAFMNVYWQEDVPPEDFPMLCKELGKIISALSNGEAMSKELMKGLVDDDEDDEDDEKAAKEARYKQFLGAYAQQESTTGDGNVEKAGEDGEKVEQKTVDLRLLKRVTGDMQALLHQMKKEGGAK